MNTVADPPERPRQRPARKIHREKVLALKSLGVSVADIAKSQGVDRRTIFRFLASTDDERKAVETFKAHRAEIFAKLQAESLNVQAAIVQSLVQDGVLASLTPHQKTGLLSVLSAQHGTLYDKERLERNQSTTNVSIIHRIMTDAMDRAGKTTTDGGTTEPTQLEDSSS